jgi:ACS family tartrate transporter-like MFS transporter
MSDQDAIIVDRGAESAEARATMAKVAWRLLPFLILCYVVNYLDRVNVGFAALTMNRALGFTATVFGLGAGVFFIAYIAGEVPSNLLMQRFGARRWIARIMITWGIISGLMATVSGEASFYGLRFLLGLAEAGFFPGIILYLTWWFPSEYRGRIIGLFMVAAPLSGVFGAPVSGLLLGLDGVAGLQGWQWLFILEALPSVAIGFAVLGFLTDRPDQAHWLAPAERDWLSRRLTAEQTVRERTTHLSLRQVLRDRRVLALGVVYAGAALANYGLSLWTPQIIKAFGGVSNLQTGFLTAIPYLCASVGMILWTRHSDRTRERVWHVAGAGLLTCAGFLACSVLQNPAAIMVALCFAAIGSFSLVSSFWTLPTAFLSGTAAAAGLALINAIGSLGGFFGPYIIGALRDSTGDFSLALLPIAAGPLLSAIIVVVLGRGPVAEA